MNPPLLKPGDKVGIVAPARKPEKILFERAADTIRSWGLDVVYGKNLFSDDHTYLSSTDENRLGDLQQMLDDDSLKAIICARGGYGSTRIIDKLDLTNFKRNPKWFVGFSDITAIHLLFFREGINSIHAIMPMLFPRSDSGPSVESLRKFLFEGTAVLNTSPSTHNRKGEAHTTVIGGNLSLLTDSLGTKSEPDTRGKILLIEEVDEYFYKMDRMMIQLKRSGKLEHLAGLAVGHMTEIKNGELTFSNSIEELILDSVKEYNFPVAFNFPTGHENPNLAWIHGGKAKLTVTDSASLIFDAVTQNI